MNLSHNLSLLTKSIGTRLGYDDSHSNLGNEFNALKSDAKAFRVEIEKIGAAVQVCSFLRFVFPSFRISSLLPIPKSASCF